MEALRAHRVRQAEERLRLGLGKGTEDGLVFASEIGTPLDAGNVLRRAFRRTLERAALPHMPFHSLRHTNATLAIEAGVQGGRLPTGSGTRPPSLVMNHLRPRHPGDASGRHRRPRARHGELMRSALLHFLLQNDPAEAGGVVVCADLLAFLGEPGGIRTHDQGIKSPLLYR